MVDFSFSSQKVLNLDVSISSRIMRFVCKISLSLLETRENIFGFLFSSRNWRKCLKFLHFFGKNSRSLLEPENRSRHFSFLFSKLEMWIPYFSFSSRFDFLASRQCLALGPLGRDTYNHTGAKFRINTSLIVRTSIRRIESAPPSSMHHISCLKICILTPEISSS